MNKDTLYENLGELIYIVAKADGVIQKEEIDKLKEILKDHPYADSIQWSFNFVQAQDASIDDVYRRVIDSCYELGPLEEYSEFVDIMAEIANAHDGVSLEEGMMINSFATELMVRFKNDLAKLEEKKK